MTRKQTIIAALTFTLIALCLSVTTVVADEPVSSPNLASDSFERPIYDGFYAWFGELHQHTGYSPDGCGLPERAIHVARSRDNDFFAFTDHHNSFYFPEIGDPLQDCRIDQLDYFKWETLLEIAQASNDEGKFISFRGYEYTRDPGHMNVFNSANYAAPFEIDEQYEWLAGEPQDVFAHFCHPLPHYMNGIGDFEGFRYFPPVAHRIREYEISDSWKFDQFLPFCLDEGWYVSSVGYGDSHNAETSGSRHYGIMSDELTTPEVFAALQSGRTFGNTDGRLAAAIQGNGQWMGSPITTSHVVFDVYAADALGDELDTVELLCQKGVIASWQPEGYTMTATVVVDDVAPGDYFYLHVVDENGGNGWSGTMMRPQRSMLQATPATSIVTFHDASDEPQTAEVLIDTNVGDGPWRIRDAEEWLAIEPTSGEGLPATLSVTVDPTHLVSGTQTGGFVVEADGLTPVVIGIEATLGDGDKPVLELSPREVDLILNVDEPQLATALDLDNPAALTWHACTNEPWLQLDASTGSSAGALSYAIDMSGYEPGIYTGHVIVMLGRRISVSEVRVALQPSLAQTVVYQRGTDREGDWQDTVLNAWYPSTPQGTKSNLKMRSISHEGTSIPLVQVDVSEVPADACVLSATLSLYCYELSVASDAINVRPYQLTEAWSEQSATWDSPGETWSGDALGEPGENRAQFSCDNIIVHTSELWYDMDITEPVRQWVQDPNSNHGLAIVGDLSNGGNFAFISSNGEGSSRAMRPVLSLTYGTAPTPTPEPTLPPAPGTSISLPLIVQH